MSNIFCVNKSGRSIPVYSDAQKTTQIVACLTALSGDTNPHWKAINYVENSSTGQWDAVTGDGVTYGYVDTGLDYASGYSKIPLYGSW